MKAKEVIEKAIKEARKKKPGVIISRDDIYNAIFKAGFNEALNTVVATQEYDLGKEVGIKEVVNWIKQQPKIGTGVFIVGIEHEQIYGWKVLLNELQAKLKEWGIDDQEDGR